MSEQIATSESQAVTGSETIELVESLDATAETASEGGAGEESATSQESAEAKETTGDSGEEKPEDAQKKSDIQKRIDSLTRRRYQLESRNDELEMELANTQAEMRRLQARAGVNPQLDPSAGQIPVVPDPNNPLGLPPKPQREGFATYEDFVEALGQWTARKEFTELTLRQRQAAQTATVQQQQAVVVQKWSEQINTAREKYEDYDEVVGNRSIQMSQNALRAIIESPVGAEIAYFLGRNPQEAQQLNTLPPGALDRRVGQLEALFIKPAAASGSTSASATQAAAASTAAPAVISPKPKPKSSGAVVNPVKAGAGSVAATQKDPSKMSMREYNAWRDAGGGRG